MINMNLVGDIERIVVNRPKKYDNTERVLLIDGDSITYLANYGSEEDIDECKFKLKRSLSFS